MFTVTVNYDDATPPAVTQFSDPADVANALPGLLEGKEAVFTNPEDPDGDALTGDAWQHLREMTGGDLVGPISRLKPGQYLHLETTEGNVRVNRVS